jgi:anti-sigma B factor antagonist
MDIHVRDDDGVTVIAPAGPVDVAASLELRDALAVPISQHGARVLVDLTDVTLVDSSGVGIFVTAHRSAEAAGASFALAGAQGPVGRVFEMTRTNKLLRIFESVDAGLEALRAP